MDNPRSAVRAGRSILTRSQQCRIRSQRCLDAIRRRFQQQRLGHRGRKADPPYKIRKILLTGDERLTDRGRERLLDGLRLGDPHDEVLGGWLTPEMVRDIYLTDDVNPATVVFSRAIKARLADDVPEIQALGRGHEPVHQEAKRAGHGYRRFDHHSLRVLLHAGGCN